MAQIAYVTLEEAAELEGITYNAMQLREGRGSVDTKLVPQKSGGKPLVLVAVNSLSKMAQNAKAERDRLMEIASQPADPDAGKELEGKQERPWYVDIDYEWFMHQYQKKYYEACELGNVIRRFLQESRKHKGDLTEFTDQFAKDNLSKSGRTFRRMVEAYQEAENWAAVLGKRDGCSYDYFKVIALCRKPKTVGTFPSIPEDMKQAVKNIWFEKEFAQNRRNRQDLYEVLEEIAVRMGWKKLPSYQTVNRYVSWLMEHEGLRSAYDYQRNGAREWKNKNMVKRIRDTKGLKVLEMLQGDEHTFDLWVMYKTKSGKEIPIRPKLVAWIDTRSRMILGDIICRDADSQVLKESLIKLMYEDLPGQVPRYLYIDNGKDYTSKEMIGVDRKDRHNQEAKDRFFDMEFDRATRGFYHDMGIQDEHVSMPYEPWTKAQIERSFRTVIEKFSKKYASYTGTLTGSGTDAKVNKEIKRMAERGELLTMEEFYEEWRKYKEKYNSRMHSGLKRAGEAYKTPKEVFEYEERYVKPAPPRSFAVMALMKSEKARVNNVGIRRNGYYYMSDELLPYINQEVDIKIDPYDVTAIYVINKFGQTVCKAVCQELLQFGTVSDDTLKEHRKQQNRQLKEVKKAIEEATVPFDGDTKAAHKGMVGGVNLTIGKEPVKSKVVAMPSEGLRRHKRQVQDIENSEYMKSQAEKAMEKLRQIQDA